jgi:replicative DNA helicase
MAYEDKLLSKAIQTESVEKLIAYGIDDRHFADFQSKEIWSFLTEHLKKYGASPSLETFKSKFPDFEFDISTEPIDFLKDNFIKEVKLREAKAALYDIGEIIDKADSDSIGNIDEIFLAKAQDLTQVIPSNRIGKFSDMKSRIQSYKNMKDNGVNPGMLFGIPQLDEVTLGLQSHEYITIAGNTGLGKSTLLFQLAINHYVEGYTPMIISLEMSDQEIYRKMDAMAVGLKQMAMKRMDLAPNDMRKWEEFAEKVEGAANDIIIVDVDDATPEKVYAETARWNPDVVGVDYVQLLTAPKYLKQGWEKVGYVSQQMKKLARQLDIPVYGLAQTNAEAFDEGAKLSNLGQSKDIGRHSDIVLGLAQNEEEREMKKLELRVLKNRGGVSNKSIYMKWDHHNSIYEEWKEIDSFNV